jgi:lysophospholipase L1-like esterase
LRANSRHELKRALRHLGTLGLVFVLALVLGEGLLRAGSLLVRGRAAAPPAGMRHVVLCAGDSHTYGAGVPAVDSYPARLRAILDAYAPGEYVVVNVGVPGMSTTQVLHRLPDQVRSLHPDTVVIWCGINDSWNTSELDSGAVDLRRAVRDALRATRLYRLWRVWRHNEELFKPREWDRIANVPRPRVASDSGTNPNRTLTVDWGDRIERLPFTGVEDADPDARVASRAAANYEAMARLAQAAGANVVFVTYPIELGRYIPTNRTIRTAAARATASLVESRRALARVPQERRQWVLMFHPTRPIYREIAHDVARAIIKGHCSAARVERLRMRLRVPKAAPGADDRGDHGVSVE